LDASEQPPKIDLALRHSGERWSEEQRAVLPDGVRDRHCQHHLFEFKITESVNQQAFKQAAMYDYLYPQLRKVEDHEFQTYIVSSRTTLKKNLKAWGYKQVGYPGVYESTHPLSDYIVILLLNELRDLPHNNYFRLFASEKKIRESALESLLQTHTPYLTDDRTEEEIVNAILAVGKAYNIEVEGLNMERGLTVEWLLERGEDIRQGFIQSATLEERLVGLKPEELLRGLKPEVLGMYKPEQVLGMYKPEERILGMKREEKRLLMEALQHSLQMDDALEETTSGHSKLEIGEAEKNSDIEVSNDEIEVDSHTSSPESPIRDSAVPDEES